jgi:hypothetical protein
MKGLISTAASRAWLGVALVGVAIVGLVLALSLIPRLSAGQQVIDTARPAFTDERVAGTRAGVDVVSRYVDLLDPLLTPRGGASHEVRSLVRLIARERGLSNARARRILRREAPHAEALMRALPLEGVAAEISPLTSYLSTTLAMSEDELAATLEQSFPRIAQLLSTLPNVTDAWNDVPGIEGLTRLSRGKPVRSVPGLRKYLRDDVVPLTIARKDDFQRLAGSGGIGYIPYMLLIVGLVMFAYGLLQTRRAAITAPGARSWSVIAAIGVLVIVLVAAAQYFPRLRAGDRLISDLRPVFAQDRVKSTSIGFDSVHEAIVLGDPIMTRSGGAGREAPRLYGFVADRTGRTPAAVRRALSRRTPRTIALLDSLPLTRVAREARRLVAYLARALRMARGRLVALLRRRAPGLTRALLAAPAVTAGWPDVPGTGALTRFDGLTPVRSVPAVDDYLRLDVIPVLVKERAHFDSFASGSPSLSTLGPALLILGVVVMLYGGLMMQLVARR